MIERDADSPGYYVACDVCSNDMIVNQTEFLKVIEVMRMRGWKSIKGEFGWEHLCPECQEA